MIVLTTVYIIYIYNIYIYYIHLYVDLWKCIEVSIGIGYNHPTADMDLRPHETLLAAHPIPKTIQLEHGICGKWTITNGKSRIINQWDVIGTCLYNQHPVTSKIVVEKVLYMFIWSKVGLKTNGLSFSNKNTSVTQLRHNIVKQNIRMGYHRDTFIITILLFNIAMENHHF